MCFLFFLKSKIKNLVEVELMIVPRKLSEMYSDKEKRQVFSSKRDDYVLDKETGELELLPTQYDMQEYISSYSSTALDKMLDKFSDQLPIDESRKAVYGYADMKSDLSTIGKVYATAEEYRQKFGLSADMSIKDIYDYIGKQAEQLKENLSKQKGGVKNERSQEDKPQAQPQTVSPDGEENA